MACLWQNKYDVWCLTYRENGKQSVRSLRTKSKREAVKLQREVESILDGNEAVDFRVQEQPKEVPKNPTLDGFWKDFLPWAQAHRTPSTVEEYQNWFTQFREFTGIERLGDATRDHLERFKKRLWRVPKCRLSL
jgi:hypothetical protein